MSQFYVSIMFIGITLIVISFVWILYDRKKAYDYTKSFDEKKAELVSIVSDAEQMIEELNKFSDYIVAQMDFKNDELCANLKRIDEKVAQLNQIVEEKTVAKVETKVYQSEKIVNGAAIDIISKPQNVNKQFNYNSDLIIENLNLENKSIVQPQTVKQGKVKDKVIPINNRYKEVIRLCEDGFSDTEIAKKLNMGKGEVQLILGMNK